MAKTTLIGSGFSFKTHVSVQAQELLMVHASEVNMQ